ncbi:MAG: archaemetzincin family Zn-dependent metalloprotease [Candidatus Aenigmatarchaeota archaeon]
MFLRIVPIGDVSESMLNLVKSELESLNIKSRIMPKVAVPKEAYNQWRKQYNAEILMDVLSKVSTVKFIDKNIPTLLLTDADLYYNGLNFIFGLEEPTKSCAIVSLARLKPEFYDQKPSKELLEERLVKEVIHELGHYFGLDHCENTKCVMCFSPSVFDVDKKQKEFCDNCKIKIMARGINLW